MRHSNVIRLTKTTPIESVNYFVDANVWIYSLQAANTLTSYENEYSEYFYDIHASTLDPPPKILLTSLLVSEIINTYLRRFAMEEYRLSEKIPSDFKLEFKKHYRPTQHFKDSYTRIVDDILAMKSSIRFLSDSIICPEDGSFGITKLLNRSIRKLDYNDYLYYTMCQELNKSEPVVLLTNDSDFQITDLKIITKHPSLLDF